MSHPKGTQERVLHRVKIIQGHLQKVRNMVEHKDYCIDILHQSQAVQGALHNLDEVIMENHLKTCVADAIKKGDDRKAVAEVMSIFSKRKT